ncbi:hypothetical protein FQR65_LT12374 [Abscondita terminalis]|nr:hypothetical protein FQR65_LT12374 [Abscondita terminalis]
MKNIDCLCLTALVLLALLNIGLFIGVIIRWHQTKKYCGDEEYRSLSNDLGRSFNFDVKNWNKYPFIVSIVVRQHDSHIMYCAGVIINSKWILTTGHCANLIRNLNKVVYAATPENRILSVHIHDSYHSLNYSCDIGLLYVKEKFLPDSAITISKNAYALNSKFLGFGYSDNSPVNIFEGRYCKELHGAESEILSNSTFCIESSVNDTLACYLDIGLPLLDDKAHLVGIVSWGRNCGILTMSEEDKSIDLAELDGNICAECQQPAELKCSGCKSVAYCCKDHQKKHWKIHKGVCRPFEIQTSLDLGRHLVATRDLNAGDMILCENPLVFGPRPHIVEEGPVPCIGCFRLILAEQSPRCDGCGWPVCHTSCPGLKDPLNHGLECLILGLRPEGAINHFHDFYRQDTLLVLRCLLLQKKGQKKWEQLMEMEPHLEARGPNTEVYKNIEERIVKYLTENFLDRLKDLERKAERDLLPETSSSIMHRIAGIIDVNALEINQDAELSAVYPMTSLLEHSCISNTYHVFDDSSENYKITVRASVPIKKGEHISTMYTHALWGTQARREHLKETKYFYCKCSRCKDPTELGTYLSALRCIGIDGKACGGIQLPLEPCNDRTEWACDKCDIKLTNDEVAFLVNKIGEEVDYVQLSNPTVKEMRDLLEKILNFLHPHHYHVYSVKHSLLQLYGYQQGYLPNQISDDLLLKKSEMCRELIEITKTVDPGNARLPLYTAVLLHELFLANAFYVKRKWHVEDKKQMVILIEEAVNALSEAKLVLKNEASSAGQKLRSLLASSNKELKNWMDRYREDLEKVKKEMEQLSI